jgi:hypothetical protein
LFLTKKTAIYLSFLLTRPGMRFNHILLALLALLSLSACGSRDFFGLQSTAPDEFAVVDHPPLSMPPDYALRPPRPGEASPQMVQPSVQAAQALYGSDKMEMAPGKGAPSLANERLSTAEQALVSTSGATTADPQIRRTLDRESTQQVVTSRRLIDNMLFWRANKAPQGPVVDPIAERQRIDAAKLNNAPVTAGGTPIVGAGAKSGETVQ